jgi:hypothetical protein
VRPPNFFALAVAALLATASLADAFTQNVELEAWLNISRPEALVLFPSKGYRDGAAGFFRDNDLQVVPNSARAWCQEQTHGVLKPGCYVEWFFHFRGYNQRTMDGKPCGHLTRWYRPPDKKMYAPTPGSPFAEAITKGDMNVLDLEVDYSMPMHFLDARRHDWCGTKSQ